MSTLEELVRQIDADAELAGWDQPERVYEIHGTNEDPYPVLITPVGVDPVVLLLAGRIDINNSLGIVTCSEAWRALTYEEMLEVPAINRQLDNLRAQVDFLARIGINLDLDQAVRSSWQEFCDRVPPSAMRPEARREVRVVFATTSSGTIVSLSHDRAGAITCTVIDAKDLDPERPPEALMNLLHLDEKG